MLNCLPQSTAPHHTLKVSHVPQRRASALTVAAGITMLTVTPYSEDDAGQQSPAYRAEGLRGMEAGSPHVRITSGVLASVKAGGSADLA